MFKGKTTLSLQCLYQMSPLNHKRTTSSLVQPRFYIAKKSAIKDIMSQLPSKHKIYMFSQIYAVAINYFMLLVYSAAMLNVKTKFFVN